MMFLRHGQLGNVRDGEDFVDTVMQVVGFLLFFGLGRVLRTRLVRDRTAQEWRASDR